MCIRDRFKVVYKLSDASEGVTCGYMDHSDNIWSVSYTHLDVYKRQGTSCVVPAAGYGLWRTAGSWRIRERKPCPGTG